jgi:hypothetical protein
VTVGRPALALPDRAIGRAPGYRVDSSGARPLCDAHKTSPTLAAPGQRVQSAPMRSLRKPESRSSALLLPVRRAACSRVVQRTLSKRTNARSAAPASARNPGVSLSPPPTTTAPAETAAHATSGSQGCVWFELRLSPRAGVSPTSGATSALNSSASPRLWNRTIAGTWSRPRGVGPGRGHRGRQCPSHGEARARAVVHERSKVLARVRRYS